MLPIRSCRPLHDIQRSAAYRYGDNGRAALLCLIVRSQAKRAIRQKRDAHDHLKRWRIAMPVDYRANRIFGGQHLLKAVWRNVKMCSGFIEQKIKSFRNRIALGNAAAVEMIIIPIARHFALSLKTMKQKGVKAQRSHQLTQPLLLIRRNKVRQVRKSFRVNHFFREKAFHYLQRYRLSAKIIN